MPSLNVHSILTGSKANGPGLRTVVWFQGCSMACEGCFNPATHPFTTVQLYNPEELASDIIVSHGDIEGITLSGGEPMDQAEGLALFLNYFRNHSSLSVILLSGYTYGQILKSEFGAQVLGLVDILIAGPYVRQLSQPARLAGSSNKTFHFLTGRYSIADLANIPDAEVVIAPDGTLIYSGIDQWQRFTKS